MSIMNIEHEKVLHEINNFVKNRLPLYDYFGLVKFVYNKLQNDTIFINQELSEFYFSFNTLQYLINSINKEIENNLFIDKNYQCFVSIVQSKTVLVRSQEHGTEWNEYEYEVLISIQ